jgi:hypothetical protein
MHRPVNGCKALMWLGFLLGYNILAVNLKGEPMLKISLDIMFSFYSLA